MSLRKRLILTRNKLAIIGASELQNPLILKAREMGIETHVFAWEAGDVGETTADYFYPISIIEKEAILEKCQEIGIDGVTTIASDLATVAMCYVSNHMGLSGNSLECNKVSTNKHDMRLCFEEHHDSSPKSVLVSSIDDLAGVDLTYPVIVKPLDRSGSRGITKVERDSELAAAIEAAKSEGFEKKALVEEYATGQEYSVEYVS
ncbi:MAG: ATP-grasp domain-containing protein, partial [Pseudobutyrivibrio sp.]|nr:ATP-grasp domain-containing protein [Pseudobutyrivibrio sp.]